jgi:hypothetical protein
MSSISSAVAVKTLQNRITEGRADRPTAHHPLLGIPVAISVGGGGAEAIMSMTILNPLAYILAVIYFAYILAEGWNSPASVF